MVMVSKFSYKGSGELDDGVNVLNSERSCVLSEGLSALAYGIFHARLVSFGIGGFLRLFHLRWGGF
jgi:hypothetical protein